MTKNKSHAELMKTLKPGERYFLGAGIFARRTKTGVTYGISYKFDGTVIREMVGTRTDAKLELANRRVDISEGRNPRPKRAPLFRDFANEYLEWSKDNKRSWRRDKTILQHLRARFDNKRLDQIQTKDVQDFIANRAKEFTPTGKRVSPRTVNLERSCLRRMFSLALFWKRLDPSRYTNPVNRGAKPRTETSKPRRVLTRDEETRLLAAAKPYLQQIITFGLHTGMRPGQIMALKWSAIDWKTNTITAGPMTDEDLESGHHKNEANPIVPITARLARLLNELPRCSVFVFTRDGKPIKCYRRPFSRAVKAAGIKYASPHSTRHTFCTRQLIDCGTDLKTVMEMVGHKHISTTQKYLHTNEEYKREAQRRYDELFG
ncbi:MAG: tyrosine-type recombinase/integrase [Candidatus Krumholzibacteria bacterium]